MVECVEVELQRESHLDSPNEVEENLVDSMEEGGTNLTVCSSITDIMTQPDQGIQTEDSITDALGK